MTKGIYYVCHRNSALMAFELIDGEITRYEINKSKMILFPLGVTNGSELVRWVRNRGIPVTRDGITKDLGKKSPFEIMIDNLGLSLTDHYWIKPLNTEYTWENINLYQNDFKSHYSLNIDDDIKIANIAGRTNFIPSTSLKGDLKKKWIIDAKGNRVIVKGNYNKGCIQSISEVFATEIHSRQGIQDFVSYKLININSGNSNVIGCMCHNFTDINTEFIPAIDVINTRKKRNNISYYEMYLKICEEFGCDKEYLRKFMEYQIMTDFIISNTDRHFNNFGVLRDVNTLRFISTAPIFDSGNSLFYNSSYVPIDKALLKIEVTSFLRKEVEMLRYIKDRGLVDLRKLPSPDELYNLLKLDVTAKDEYIDRIIKAYLKKIKYISDFQNGANIWEYNTVHNIFTGGHD